MCQRSLREQAIKVALVEIHLETVWQPLNRPTGLVGIFLPSKITFKMVVANLPGGDSKRMPGLQPVRASFWVSGEAENDHREDRVCQVALSTLMVICLAHAGRKDSRVRHIRIAQLPPSKAHYLLIYLKPV